jgi:hypothetical protein
LIKQQLQFALQVGTNSRQTCESCGDQSANGTPLPIKCLLPNDMSK